MIKLQKPASDLVLHPSLSPESTTHLAIGAHADDLEIMAYHGIATCYEDDEQWFSGITVTNGVGSPQKEDQRLRREELRLTRQKEQREAASLGNYALIAQLDYESQEVKEGSNDLQKDLLQLLRTTKPKVVYLHQPADKHPTHIAVLKASLAALQALPEQERPMKVWGCEVWRDLDWLPDEKKIYLESGAYPDLARDILAVFQSQISAGVDYVNGTLGRRLSNGTFADPHVVREGESFTLAIDLMPCLKEEISLSELILPEIDSFRKSVFRELT